MQAIKCDNMEVIDYDGRDFQSFKKPFCDKFSMLLNNCIWKLMKCSLFAKKIIVAFLIFLSDYFCTCEAG